MVAGISLANKCQLLFGAAVVAILAATLSVPWLVTGSMVHQGALAAARQLADDRLATDNMGDAVATPPTVESLFDDPQRIDPWRVTLLDVRGLEEPEEADSFLVSALRRFRDDAGITERTETRTEQGRRVYRYVRALRADAADDETPSSDVMAILLVERTSRMAEGRLLRNRVYIIAIGLLGGLLAVGAFSLILSKLFFEPVRQLRETTERIRAGDLAIRSDIKTGDEFEQLSEAFNSMLERVERSQARLQSMNESLDLKVTELEEANVGLSDSNRLKSEFLAGVSHELRTPLNSIIGFTEVLDELAHADENADPKRQRYIQNILNSGRALLEMINDLLEMAKIEAGRMEVVIEPTSVSDLIEGLAGIMGPPAEQKKITLETKSGRTLPMIETDPGKLQQILYNFLSNAIKFTPENGSVTISADRLTQQGSRAGVRLSVSDTGPGIPYDMQDAIFEKFRQVDAGHTRAHAGTGLGLAICRELAELLGATVSLVSEPGQGATFIVDLPLTHQPHESQPLMA